MITKLQSVEPQTLGVKKGQRKTDLFRKETENR